MSATCQYQRFFFKQIAQYSNAENGLHKVIAEVACHIGLLWIKDNFCLSVRLHAMLCFIGALKSNKLLEIMRKQQSIKYALLIVFLKLLCLIFYCFHRCL